MTERDENLPQLHLSPEMEDIVQDLATERGVSADDIKYRARLILDHLGIEE
jgi:hypothetical protein